MSDGEGFSHCRFCHTQALAREADKAEREELMERIRQLEAQLYGRDYEPPKEFGLTPLEGQMFCAFMACTGRTLTKEFLVEATRTPSRRYDVEPKLADTVVCKMRAKLKPFGIEIETVWGRGYRLSDESRERLTNWPTQQAA